MFVFIVMDQKRKATSPQGSDFKSQRFNSTDSFASCESESDSEMEKTRVITVRVLSRNGEPFLGGLTRSQGKIVWLHGFKLPETLLFGISLVETKGKPFMFDFRLNCEVEIAKIPPGIEVKIGDNNFALEHVPLNPTANVGDVAVISFKRTRFKITPEQLNEWMQLYGEVLTAPDYVMAPEQDCKSLRTDEIRCKVRIKKHIPNLLPAFGLRLNVQYVGQPVQCGRCFAEGHVRAKCGGDQADWLTDYVKLFYAAGVSSRLLGRWFDLIKSSSE